MPLIKFIKQILAEFGKDKVGQLSAAFAYISLFALAPLMLVLISIAGFVFGERAVEGRLYSSLRDAVGPNTASSIQQAVAHTHTSGRGGVALIIGIVGTLLAATALTNQLQNAFNVIFRAVPDPRGGIKHTIYTKVKNIVLLVAGAIVVAASVAVSILVTSLGKTAENHLGLPAFSAELVNAVASLLVFVIILYLIYRVLPDVVIPRKVVLTVAVIVGLLFLVGKIILGVIIGRNGTASAYGAAGSLIALLLWFYYSGQILFLGAEGIKVYGHNHSLTYQPKKFTQKRQTAHADTQGRFSTRFVEGFMRGFRRKAK